VSPRSLIAYLYGAGAQMMLLVSDRKRYGLRRIGGEMTLALLAVAYSIWMIYGAGYRFAAWAFMLVAAGIPCYVWMKWEASKEHPELVHPEVLDEIPTTLRTEEMMHS